MEILMQMVECPFKKEMQHENNMSDVSDSGSEQEGSEASVENNVSQDRSGYGLEQVFTKRNEKC